MKQSTDNIDVEIREEGDKIKETGLKRDAWGQLDAAVPVSHSTMKMFLLLSCLSLALAKPQFGTDLGLTEGRIIGGEEAPKRNQ